jgi:WD40 repeat protein
VRRTLMPMGYCYYCDRPVEGDTCPTCGRPAWVERSSIEAAQDLETPRDTPQPEPTPWRLEVKPWMVATTVVAIGLVLSILTVPSGFQHVTTPTPPPITTTTTTTIPRPGANRPAYQIPTGTWVGLIRAETPPETLTGSFPFLAPAQDVLFDGSLLLRSSDAYVRMTPTGVQPDLPIGAPTDLMDVEVAPNGRLLATVDATGQMTVWDLTTNEPTSLEPISFGDPFTEGQLYWSPDSSAVGLDINGQRYRVWSADGPLTISRFAGARLVALGNVAAAVASDEDLRIEYFDGTLIARPEYSEVGAAAFDPSGRYLAVDATVTEEGSGVWLIDLADLSRELVAPSGSAFAWSGDGSALYFTDETGTFAYPIGSQYSVTQVSSRPLKTGDHLRVYDPALVPVPTFLVHTGNLFELRDSKLQRRAAGGLTEEIEPLLDRTTTSILSALPSAPGALAIDPATPLLRTADTGTGSNVSLLDTTGKVEHLLGTLPSGSVTSVLDAPNLGIFVGTDQGEVFEAAPNQELTHVFDGRSLGMIGAVPFAVSGTSIVELPAESETPAALIDVADLTGSTEILDAVGIRFDLLVLTRTRVGTPALYWIPGDSELLGDAVFPSAPLPNLTPFSLVYTPLDSGLIDTGRLIAAGDGQTFALELTSPDGVTTILMADPGPGQTTCGGVVVCTIGSVEGRALGFSPDGAWLLVDSGGAYFAISTRARGSVRIDETAPDQITWIP